MIHGNRAEALLGALLEALPAADPFAPSTIVVGSHLVARWLSREIALARGIAAGLELVTFDGFVERAWGNPELAVLDQAQLAAAIASVLADDDQVRRIVPVAQYLAAAPAQGDRAGPRRVQLAEQVAHLAWQYALERPDWMAALVGGHVPGELAAVDDARWQAALIGAALRGRALVPMLPWLRRRAGLPPPASATPVSVFGMSFLSRAQLEALTDLSSTTDVAVYLLDPCRELWDDVGGRRAAGSDPLPLTLWGRPVRDTLGALVERTGGDVDAAFVTSPGTTAREALLDDVLHRRAPSGPAAEPGVTVLACPNARRELEIIASEIRRRLDADPSLSARDVGVWLAGDTERYLAQAPSAFEAVGVPCHLIDAPIDDRGRIGEAVLALLELPTSAMTRRDLLRVMTHPAVLAGHPHVTADDWVRWTERLGIVHGADHAAHDGTYLAEHPGRFHWDQGVRRLALGAFMVGIGRGPVAIAGIEVAPEEVRPDQHASAATYALLVRSLCADASWLATHEATLAEWARVFVELVDAYLARRTGDAARDVERVRSMLAGIAHVDVDGRKLGFREAREHATRRLVGARADRGEPLAAGAMIAPLRAMRAIPFRVVFVAGLDEGAFPAGDQPNPLDLRREPRPGDVAPRDRDRHAFFEVLLGARDALYLSYVAVEAKSGEPLGPSSVVLELADALAPYLVASSSRAALELLTTHHPLHRFSGAGDMPPAIARERWAVRVRDAMRAHLRGRGLPVPDADGMLALLANDRLGELRAALGLVEPPAPATVAAATRPLTIANLRTFLEAPVQAWAQAVLGLDELPDDDAVVDRSDEPFHVERPARAIVLREALAAQLRGPTVDPARCYDAVVRDLELRGQFPVGVFGDAARTIDLRVLERWRDELGPVTATRLAFGRASSPTAELVPALDLGRVRLVGQTELLLGTGKRTSVIPLLGAADKKSRYHLRGALDHVVLAAAGLATEGHAHMLLGAEGKVLRVDHDPWTRDDARAFLDQLIGELLDHSHGYLLPFEHLVRALAGGKPARAHGEVGKLLGFGPIDRLDGLAAPADAPAIARRRLGPLVERMHGDHTFEGRVVIARPASLPPASDRFVVVEASAGTGKTYFLEHRVVDLILAGAQLGQILLVTFTDKAVAELRLRIRDLLDRLARADSAAGWTLDDDARARLRAAVTAFDHAPIFTIHGFCHRVLVEDAFAARRLFAQTRVADEVAFDAAFDALIRERWATHDRALLGAYLEVGNTVDTLRKLLLACARADAAPRRRFDRERAVALGDALRAAFGTEDARAKLIAALPSARHWAPARVEAIGAAVARIGGDPAHVLAACDDLREAAGLLVERLAKSHPAVASTLRDAVATMSLDEAVADEMLPPLLARIGADKAERGLFDYDDMLRLVLETLRDDSRGPALAARLRARTPWVMIDEAQDTDPTQWEIFRRVWLHDAARGLTIVGDPKQAIYGFRGADVATYQAAHDELVRGGATVVALDENRRSTAPLVDAVDAILRQPLAPLLDKSITYDHPVRAAGDVECDGARPPITVLALRGPNREPNRDALAGAIGVEIDRLRASPPVWRRRGEAPPFALRQILVLTRTNGEGETVAAALRARGLPCALVESDQLFETREAAELAAVLEAIAAPRDRSARMRALRTRFFDVPWTDLMRVVDAPDHHPLVARLFDWAALAGRRGYEELFRRLVEDSRFAERALVLGGGERAVVNTWHLIELLLEEVARSRGDLHELVGQLRRWIADRDEVTGDRGVQRAETDADAIRILTIHKAKGLEAPYVFVFGAASPGPRTKVRTLRDAAGRALLVDSHDDAELRRLSDEADAENQRLAYVALTRAQVRLYLPLYGDKVVDDTSTYHPIQRCLAPLVARRDPRFELVDVVVGGPPDAPAPPDALAELDAPSPPPTVELTALPAARAGLAMLSYTRLAHDVDAAAIEPGELPLAIDPAEFAADDSTGEVAPGELPPGLDTGIFLHAVLEQCDLDGIRRARDPEAWRADPAVAALLADRARECGISEAYLPHAARVVHTTLTAPFGDDLPPLVDAKALAREVEFTYPIPGGRGLVRGFIDALVVWDDALWVVDYKSDLLDGSAADHVRTHYAVQARLYAIAADRLRGVRPLGGLLFAFVRHHVVVPVHVTDEAIAEWTRWLGELRVEDRR